MSGRYVSQIKSDEMREIYRLSSVKGAAMIDTNEPEWKGVDCTCHSQLTDATFFVNRRYCGVIDTKRIGLVTSIERIVEFVFMQALAYPNSETDEDDIGCSLIKTQLLPGLRSFCSALRVCEQVCQHVNVFDDGKPMFVKIDNCVEVRELAKNKEFCEELEERVNNWIKGVAKVSGSCSSRNIHSK